jgi:hypothetical protein
MQAANVDIAGAIVDHTLAIASKAKGSTRQESASHDMLETEQEDRP